mgnify:CR=1 FL=1
MPEEEKEVTIIDRDFVTTYPTLREPHLVCLVTYTYEDRPARVVEVDLTALFGERAEEAKKQIEARQGDLWAKYLEAEAEAIRKDITSYEARRPEVRRIRL